MCMPSLRCNDSSFYQFSNRWISSRTFSRPITYRVNVVSPGIVETPLYGGIPEDQREDMYNRIAQQLPVGSVAQPEYKAETYVYLAYN